MNSRFLLLALLSSASLTLSNCAPLVGAGAAAIGIAAVKEGGIKQSVSDTAIQATINDLWFRENVEIFRKLDLTVNQGRVLITGIVQNPEHRVDAVRLAWKAKGVKQVINEIQIADSAGFKAFLSDQWIITQIRTGITVDKEVQNLNYSLDAVNGTVYLMGVAQSQDELHRVMERARTVRGVQQVISYVKLAGEEIPNHAGAAYSSKETGRTASTAPSNDPLSSSASFSSTNTATPPPSGTSATPQSVKSEPLY